MFFSHFLFIIVFTIIISLLTSTVSTFDCLDGFVFPPSLNGTSISFLFSSNSSLYPQKQQIFQNHCSKFIFSDNTRDFPPSKVNDFGHCLQQCAEYNSPLLRNVIDNPLEACTGIDYNDGACILKAGITHNEHLHFSDSSSDCAILFIQTTTSPLTWQNQVRDI